jgi:hypothetical protein
LLFQASLLLDVLTDADDVAEADRGGDQKKDEQTKDGVGSVEDPECEFHDQGDNVKK